MSKILLDNNNGIERYWDYNEADNSTIITSVGDVSGVLEANKQMRNDGTNGYVDKSKEFQHVASIPAEIVEMWKIQYNIDFFDKEDWGKIKALLNSQDWGLLRTGGGRI